MSEKIEQLKKELSNAEFAYSEINSKITKLVEEAKAKAYVEADKLFGEEQRRLYQTKENARKALGSAEVEERAEKSAAALPYPEGTLMRKLKPDRWSSSGRSATRVTGKIQIIREGDTISWKVGKWKMPRHGDVGVREIKKDGSFGEIVHRWSPDEWMLESEYQQKKKENLV